MALTACHARLDVLTVSMLLYVRFVLMDTHFCRLKYVSCVRMQWSDVRDVHLILSALIVLLGITLMLPYVTYVVLHCKDVHIVPIPHIAYNAMYSISYKPTQHANSAHRFIRAARYAPTRQRDAQNAKQDTTSAQQAHAYHAVWVHHKDA
jgi:hypothetical protein